MPKYRVTVSIRYDDTVEVEAEDKCEAMRLAEKDAADNVMVYASLDVQAVDDSVVEID